MAGLKGRSYARIIWRKRQLGLLLVNQNQQSFFIYAETLLAVMNAENDLALIKKRDRDPSQAIGYHGGAIFASWTADIIEDSPDNLSESVTLSLYFGEVEKKAIYDKKTGELRNIIDTQTFLFPRKELESMVRGIKIMVKQQDKFQRLLYDAETNPGIDLIEIE